MCTLFSGTTRPPTNFVFILFEQYKPRMIKGKKRELGKLFTRSVNEFLICFFNEFYDKILVCNPIVLPERINKTHFERFVKNEIRNSLSDPVNSMNISELKRSTY